MLGGKCWGGLSGYPSAGGCCGQLDRAHDVSRPSLESLPYGLINLPVSRRINGGERFWEAVGSCWRKAGFLHCSNASPAPSNPPRSGDYPHLASLACRMKSVFRSCCWGRVSSCLVAAPPVLAYAAGYELQQPVTQWGTNCAGCHVAGCDGSSYLSCIASPPRYAKACNAAWRPGHGGSAGKNFNREINERSERKRGRKIGGECQLAPASWIAFLISLPPSFCQFFFLPQGRLSRRKLWNAIVAALAGWGLLFRPCSRGCWMKSVF